MVKRKITATFSDGYVNSRTTTNPNLAFGYRVWCTDPAEQDRLNAYVRSAREGFSSERHRALDEAGKRLQTLNACGFKTARSEVVPVEVV